MANTVLPDYLKSAAVESGDTKYELLFCLVQAVERQTQVMERIAVVLEEMSDNYDQRGPA